MHDLFVRLFFLALAFLVPCTLSGLVSYAIVFLGTETFAWASVCRLFLCGNNANLAFAAHRIDLLITHLAGSPLSTERGLECGKFLFLTCCIPCPVMGKLYHMSVHVGAELLVMVLVLL